MKQTTRLFTLTAIASAMALLAGCGGGGGSSSASGTTSTSIGKIDGFGSIYVNGVEYDTDGASYWVDDMSASSDDALGVGMKVKVVGRVNSDGRTGTADSIYYDDDLEGPISNLVVSGATATFDILGMNVSADENDTVYDDGASFSGLANGQEIEVSGFFDGSQLVASRIELQTDTDDDYEIKGTITQYDGVTITLDLQNGDSAGPYTIGSSAEIDLPASPVGTFAEVKLVDTGSGLEVTRIESEDEDLIDDSDNEIKLRGILVDDGSGNYSVNGIPLILNEPLPAGIGDGSEVEVEGVMDGDSLVVTEIESEDGEIEIKARVISVSNSDAKNGTITLDLLNGQSVDVTTDNSTAFEDDSSSDSDADGSFTLDELTDMDFVEVEVSFNGTDYYAYSIEREDDTETEVEAIVDDYVAGTSITVIGVTFNVDGSTSVTGTPTVGDEVKVSDDDSDGTADAIEVGS